MDSNGMSPADFAAMAGNDAFGGNNLFAMIFLFALIFGFGGFGNNGFANAIGYENLATSAEVQRGLDNQNSMANQREILAAVGNNALQEMQNNNQNTQYVTGQLMDKYNELQRDIAGVGASVQNAIAGQQNCCCNIQMGIQEAAAGINAGIAQNRYEAAMSTAQIVQAVQAEGNATRAMYQQNRYDDLLQRYNALDQRMNTQELRGDIAAATANVVRYPNGFVYNAGPSPFCGCGNGYSI